LFLHEQGLRFEVVPGIPAGLGAASYAGVPLTYPGGGDTLTFVRGHEDERKTRASVDWQSLARLDGTIVCYAGPEQLAHMLNALLTHGRPPEDTAALIYNGTLPTQETTLGTLEEIARSVRGADDRRAAILVVGRVAALREHLRWFDARPLFGKRVLVTRPREQSAELVELLEGWGAEAIEAPLIRILPPADFAPLDEACRHAGRFSWIVFASANGVEAFMSRLQASPADVRILHGVKLCAVGPGTAGALERHGLKIDLVPEEFRAEAVTQALADQGSLRGQRILLPRADIGREHIADELRRKGAEVTEVVAYRTVLADLEREGEPDIYKLLLERKIDVVTFTSASAVRSFVKLVGPEPAADLLRPTVVASIGPVTAEAAAQCSIHTTVMPVQYTIPALAAAIAEYFRGKT
jgi:uroporphyrinogen III methyltransferase/synthase